MSVLRAQPVGQGKSCKYCCSRHPEMNFAQHLTQTMAQQEIYRCAHGKPGPGFEDFLDKSDCEICSRKHAGAADSKQTGGSCRKEQSWITNQSSDGHGLRGIV